MAENQCTVIYSPSFVKWLNSLSADDRVSIAAFIKLLREHGVALAGPYSKPVQGSKINGLREFRKILYGRKIRMLYAFDLQRRAIMLTGGDKTGDKRWYEKNIPIAEREWSLWLKNRL
ncbi:MAG: type II toxin-antitoxin system RelE/ParE family toxin [Synergistaceae bacterium]|nr:type II toxin-antitoxin system RelE/ParE family toxin [Synergistaceae bacterium]